MNKELAAWIRGRPGPFAGRTHDAVWDMAWRNFNEGQRAGSLMSCCSRYTFSRQALASAP